MSLIAERLSKKADRRISIPPRQGQISYQLVGGSLIPIVDNTGNYITKGYGINDIIFSIINLVLDKVRQAPWGVYEKVDESSLKSLHTIQRKTSIEPGDLAKTKDLQIKAFKPARNPGKWGDLLIYPNEEDTFQELVANGAGFKMLTGNRMVYGNLLDMGANSGFPQELWTMPTQWMQIVATNIFPARIIKYNMLDQGPGGIREFKKETVLHEKYMNYDYTMNGSQLLGMAPLKAGLNLTTRDNSALRASAAKLQNGGLEAIIYVDEPSGVIDRADAFSQAKDIKQKLISGEYTGEDSWGKITASGYKMGVANLGLSPVELAIIDAEKWDLRRFCNLFGGVPSQLLNDPENKTYNNQKEGEKALTSRCALALLTSFRDCLNRKAVKDWKLDPKYIIDFDMTVYSELQQDVGEMMKWLQPLAEMTGLSPNRILELMGLEKQTDKIFDEPWIRNDKMGVPFSEWQLGEVDNTLSDGQTD